MAYYADTVPYSAYYVCCVIISLLYGILYQLYHCKLHFLADLTTVDHKASILMLINKHLHCLNFSKNLC